MKVNSITLVGVSPDNPKKFSFQVLEKLVHDKVKDIFIIHPKGKDIIIRTNKFERTIHGYSSLKNAPQTENLAFYIKRIKIFNENPSPKKYSRIWIPPPDNLEEWNQKEERLLISHFKNLGYSRDKILMNSCYLRGL